MLNVPERNLEPPECEHMKVTIVTKYYPGSREEPPETELLLCKCEECGEAIDWEDCGHGAVVDEVDWRDWY